MKIEKLTSKEKALAELASQELFQKSLEETVKFYSKAGSSTELVLKHLITMGKAFEEAKASD